MDTKCLLICLHSNKQTLIWDSNAFNLQTWDNWKPFVSKRKIDTRRRQIALSFCLRTAPSFCQRCCDTDGSVAACYHQIKHDRREAEASDRNNPFPVCCLSPPGWGLLKHRPKGHSAGPPVWSRQGFCFVSYLCFRHVFKLGGILSGQRSRKNQEGWKYGEVLCWGV